MNNIFLIGDSNTYGYNPLSGERYQESETWSGILKNNLKNIYNVISEGRNGRTGFYKNYEGKIGCAYEYLNKLIENSKVNDIVVLSIGTNDLQKQYTFIASEIEKKLTEMIKYIENKKATPIIIPPVEFNKDILIGLFSNYFDEKAIENSKKINLIFQKIAKEQKCLFYNFNNIAKPNQIDGLHYDILSHKKIGHEFSKYILNTNFTSIQENNKL